MVTSANDGEVISQSSRRSGTGYVRSLIVRHGVWFGVCSIIATPCSTATDQHIVQLSLKPYKLEEVCVALWFIVLSPIVYYKLICQL